jgi:hypothetical protein
VLAALNGNYCVCNVRRILLFPNGNRNQGAVSIFLENFECTQKDENEKFHVCAQFAIAILHPTDDTVYKSQGMLSCS